MYVLMFACIYVCVWMYVDKHACVYVLMFLCVYIYVYTYLLSMLHYSEVVLNTVIIHVIGSVSFMQDAVTFLRLCILFTILNNTPIV